MKLSIQFLALITLFFASCGTRNDLPAPSFVYTDGYNISMAESWDGKLLLQMASNKKLNCKNYGIGHTCTVSGNKITLDIQGVDAPPSCESGDGEATDTPSLAGLAVGTYTLSVTNEEKEILGTLTVTNNKYTIAYAGGNNVTFNTTTLNRLPANTIRGTIQVAYATSRLYKIADTFAVDSLKFYGATDFSGPLVSYTNYTVYAGNTYTSGNDPVIPNLYRHFIYDFSGPNTPIEKMIARYKQRFGDTITISMVANGQFIGTHGNGIW
jgi:hypothetical protein